jgi:hypothetical protein
MSIDKLNDSFMKEWKDGAHPNHPRHERSVLCDLCMLDHPTVRAALDEAVAEERRALIKFLGNRIITARKTAASLAPLREADEWHIEARALERVVAGLAALAAREGKA